MVRRPAIRYAFLIFAGIILFSTVMIYYNNTERQFAYVQFPEAWGVIFSLASAGVNVFSAIILVLLVSSEFDWRTGRQNIIDGLSRCQWFTARLLLIPAIILMLYLPLLVFNVSIALLGTDPSVDTFEITRMQYLAFFGTIIGAMCYSSIALLITMIARSAGPALGLTVIYPMFDDTIAKVIKGFEFHDLADCFPMEVAGALFNYSQYYPVGHLRRSWAVHEWDTPMLFFAGLCWITVLIITSWLIYKHRDL